MDNDKRIFKNFEIKINFNNEYFYMQFCLDRSSGRLFLRDISLKNKNFKEMVKKIFVQDDSEYQSIKSIPDFSEFSTSRRAKLKWKQTLG